MNLLRRHGFFVTLAIVLTATVLAYLGQLPSFVRGEHADKALHFLLFGLLSFFWVLRWGDRYFRLGRLRLPQGVVVLTALAALEELTQGLSARRSLDYVDFTCDLLGIVTFWWLARRLVASPSARSSD